MRIQHNIMAMNAYRNYGANTNALGRNLEKLSSGYKINRAGDDAAGLAISEKMRAQISGLKQAQSNVKDGISLVKTAEGALQEVQDMMNRMVTLATQSANGTYDNEVDRDNLQKEVEALKTEIDRIADSSNFNGKKLLNGELSSDTANTFKATANTATGNEAAGADLYVKTNTYKNADGENADISLTLVKADGHASGEGVWYDASGNVELVLDTAKDYTSAEIKALFQNAARADGLGDDDFAAVAEDAMKEAIANAVVSGSVDGVAGASDFGDLESDDSKGTPLGLQIGDTADTYNKMDVEVGDMHTKALGIADIDISDQSKAADAIETIKNAINTVSGTRGDLGAIQNRLEHTTNNLAIMTENIQDAESTIRDVDIADEMTTYTKNNILLQSAQAMLAQANQMPQGVLQLLQ